MWQHLVWYLDLSRSSMNATSLSYFPSLPGLTFQYFLPRSSWQVLSRNTGGSRCGRSSLIGWKVLVPFRTFREIHRQRKRPLYAIPTMTCGVDTGLHLLFVYSLPQSGLKFLPLVISIFKLSSGIHRFTWRNNSL